jgi:hypothetical protein
VDGVEEQIVEIGAALTSSKDFPLPVSSSRGWYMGSNDTVFRYQLLASQMNFAVMSNAVMPANSRGVFVNFQFIVFLTCLICWFSYAKG